MLKRFVPLLMCMTVIISACGQGKTEEIPAPVIEPIEIAAGDQHEGAADKGNGRAAFRASEGTALHHGG